MSVQSQPPWVQACSVTPVFGIPLGDRAARLDRVRDQAVVDHLELDHAGGLGERRVDRGRVAELPVEAQIARDVVMDQRLAGGGCRLGVGDHGQRVVLDVDQLGRVLGLRERLGDHEGDVIADVADAVGAEHGPQPVGALGAVPVGQRHGAGQKVAAAGFDVRAGDHGEHARRRSGRRDVERTDPGVRLGRADDAAVGLTGDVDVVGVAPLARDEALILHPPHRLADPEFRHGDFPPQPADPRPRPQHSPTDRLCQPRLRRLRPALKYGDRLL